MDWVARVLVTVAASIIFGVSIAAARHFEGPERYLYAALAVLVAFGGYWIFRRIGRR